MAIDLTRQLDIPLVEEDLQPYDLYTADEAFWTTTSMCVMPMTQVDRRPIADGKPGSDVTTPPCCMERGRRNRHRRPGTGAHERDRVIGCGAQKSWLVQARDLYQPLFE